MGLTGCSGKGVTNTLPLHMCCKHVVGSDPTQNYVGLFFIHPVRGKKKKGKKEEKGKRKIWKVT